MTTVALDGRGAERGSEAIVAGTRAAAADGIRLRVFGDPAALAAVEEIDGAELVPAAEEITNADEPVAAVRSRPQASVVLAAKDVAEGRSQAMASAGSTGATMTAALFALRRLHGVRRPALAVQLPCPAGPARRRCCSTWARTPTPGPTTWCSSPTWAPPSARRCSGSRSRGWRCFRWARRRTRARRRWSMPMPGSPSAEGLDFRGNLEGGALFAGVADVIVTDGFTGNVVLKTIEGTARTVAEAVRAAARSGARAAAGGLLLRPSLGGLRRQLDPDTTGGAILLGLRGVAVVGHGSSGPEGIANAVRLAARTVEERAVERTSKLLEGSGMTRGELRRESLRAGMRDRKEP